MEFSLLWSLFEAKALNTQGNAAAILAAALRWTESSLLTADMFEPALTYFRNRYYNGTDFTYHFDHLHLRQTKRPELVRSVLKSKTTDIANVVSVLLIVVYHFRNNLLHGLKWAYEIRGQLESFSHANTVLMRAIELHEQSQNQS